MEGFPETFEYTGLKPSSVRLAICRCCRQNFTAGYTHAWMLTMNPDMQESPVAGSTRPIWCSDDNARLTFIACIPGGTQRRRALVSLLWVCCPSAGALINGEYENPVS
jgi:hypothetical protein